MLESWVRWPLYALAAGTFTALGFVVTSYLLAMTLTRGRFGWPGLGYFARETLWVWITQSILIAGWLRSEKSVAKASPLEKLAAQRRRPIVLIHGYSQNRTNFVWLSRVLERRGLGPFFGFDYFSFRPIEESARALDAFVERLVARTGATEVDLVCHSLGGLVARTYVDLLGGHRRVRRVVTLGTPHGGILHAFMGVGASVRDMHPPTGFISRLDGAPLPETVSYHSIYSAHDNIVFPYTTSSLSTRGTDIMVRGHGHFVILFSSEVAEHVHRALTAEEALQSAARPLST